ALEASLSPVASREAVAARLAAVAVLGLETARASNPRRPARAAPRPGGFQSQALPGQERPRQPSVGTARGPPRPPPRPTPPPPLPPPLPPPPPPPLSPPRPPSPNPRQAPPPRAPGFQRQPCRSKSPATARRAARCHRLSSTI